MAWYWVIIVPAITYYGGFLMLIMRNRQNRRIFVEPADDPLPEHVATDFERTTRLLPDCVRLGTFILNHNRRVKAFTLVMEDPERQTFVSRAVVTVDAEEHQRLVSLTAFCQCFVDGTELLTTNAELESPLLSDPMVRRTILPLANTSLLREVHNRSLEKWYADAESCTPWRADRLAWLRTELVESEHKRIQQGLEFVDERTGERRPTLKAAVLTLFMVCWPFSVLRKSINLWKAGRLLAELGLPRDYTRGKAITIPKPRMNTGSGGPALFCPVCDYSLTGLTENRCPECGNAFEPGKIEQQMARGPQPITPANALSLALKPLGPLVILMLPGFVASKACA